MTPDHDKPADPTPQRRAGDRDDSHRVTPAADLQPEDACSENTPQADLGDADPAPGSSEPRARTAMKQQSRTEAGR